MKEHVQLRATCVNRMLPSLLIIISPTDMVNPMIKCTQCGLHIVVLCVLSLFID
ncbi:hypothetical protein L9F63_017250, partial [Diploptera punctata]